MGGGRPRWEETLGRLVGGVGQEGGIRMLVPLCCVDAFHVFSLFVFVSHARLRRPRSIRMIETKSGVERYDGKLLSDVPKIAELPPEVITSFLGRISRLSSLSLVSLSRLSLSPVSCFPSLVSRLSCPVSLCHLHGRALRSRRQ